MKRELTYYEILEVSTSATLTDIKNAYREKCKKNHPDVAGNTKETHELMCKINEAYEVLSNTQKRRAYDNALRANSKDEEPTKEAKEEHTTTSSEPAKEQPKQSTEEQKEEPKVRYRWTEPVFTSADIPKKNNFKTEDDYYDYIYNYYEQNDYNKEESEEYIGWIETYARNYVELLKSAYYVLLIEQALFNRVFNGFNRIYVYEYECYNIKYNKPISLNR